MTYYQLAALIVKELTPLYGEREAVALQRYLFTAVTGRSMTELLPVYREEAGEELTLSVERSIRLLKEHVPVQYITGKAWFCNLEFAVNPHVLIPRPETEELVMKIVSEADKSKAYRILDIGTGSGAVAVALALLLPKAAVTAVDISQHALDTAAFNAHNNKVKVDFVKTDILHWDPANGSSAAQLADFKFDIIVSNPPYVKRSEMEVMPPNVTLHEPHLALFVEDTDPLLFYRSIVHFAKFNLQQNGSLWFEINEGEGSSMIELLKPCGFENVSLLKDMSEKDRFVRAVNYISPCR